MKQLLSLSSERLYYSTTWLENPHKIVIPRGVTVVIGPNGAGKSLLANLLERGRNFRTNRITPAYLPHDFKVRKVEFSDIHSLSGLSSASYYQQRYEATMNDEIVTVGQILAHRDDADSIMSKSRALGLDNILHKRINYLSSGELRKLLIACTLSDVPDLLILDNPYIGLDKQSRLMLDNTLDELAATGQSIMLIVCDPRDIPGYATCVLPVSDMTLHPLVSMPAEVTDDVRRSFLYLFDYAVDTSRLPRQLALDNEPVNIIASFHDCKVSYGATTIIDSVNWTIHDNECWALTGPNGSGKSTLLSLINADNPSSYSSAITLFDRKRGSGESIWDIKRRIGYVSPEMKLYFSGNSSVLTVISQGLNDTVGNYIKLRPDQLDQGQRWIELLHLEAIADRPYRTLSSGEQQLVLLARAMIKQPRLLILDEPMHGLDYGRKRAVRALINYTAARSRQDTRQYPMSMIYVTHYDTEIPECVTNHFQLTNQTPATP